MWRNRLLELGNKNKNSPMYIPQTCYGGRNICRHVFTHRMLESQPFIQITLLLVHFIYSRWKITKIVILDLCKEDTCRCNIKFR